MTLALQPRTALGLCMDTYILAYSSLLYACELWSLNNISAHNVNVALNNSFRKIFNCC